MPNYNPKNISLEIHNESKKIARRKHLSKLGNNESFIVDGTGTNVEKYIQYVSEAKELGYNLDTYTMMDAYAKYETTNQTIEACCEAALEDER